MPRHRKECIPQHWAQPRSESSGWRGAPMNGAPDEAGAAFVAPPRTDRDGEEDDLPNLTPDELTLPMSALPAPGQPAAAQSDSAQSQSQAQPGAPRSHR